MSKVIKSNGINILIVEDNIGDARLISEILKEIDIGNYEITYASNTDELSELRLVKFDIILLDLHLSDLPPLDTYKLFNQAFPRTPIVILTGLEDDELAAKIVRQGAQDYLIKGTFGPSTLKRAIRYSIERKKSQLRLARAKTKSTQLKADAIHLKSETIRLKELNTAKDVFLSIASHQLRTPATAVKQYLGMLLEGYSDALSEEHQAFIESAYQSNERQLNIINDLLKVAQLDAGHVVLHKSMVDVNKLLQSIINEQAETFARREQKLTFLPLRPAKSVYIDEANIRMVFENILDNAGKYSPEGAHIKICISADNKHLLVAIQDNGIGISESDIAKLFKKFSRIDSSFSYSPSGSGLGLYWAQEIVKLHGGIIQLDSKIGKGSTFTVKLPISGRA